MKIIGLLVFLLLALESFKWYNQLVWNHHFENMLCSVMHNTGHKEGGISCSK